MVDCDFPGGNILLDGIDGDTVRLHQALRDTEGDWFYWYFRVRGAAGRALTFQFTGSDALGVRGPAASTDGGRTWRWLGQEAVNGASFRYAFPPDAGEVRFSFAMPYLEADLKEFLARRRESPHLGVETLCRTRRGRAAELLRLGRLAGRPEHRVLLTCRHHCCEMMASYSLEALMDVVLTDPDDGKWLREHAEFLVIPFTDKDGVEDGDQGKNRRPHDHNRDYGEGSLYPEVRALKERVPVWAEGRLRVALDLHCPHIRGAHNEVIYFVGSEDQENWQRVEEFARVLEATRSGPLPYRASDNLPFGQGWNTARNYGGLKGFTRWAREDAGARIASTIETPYANAAGQPVTAESARAFGRDLARALRRYLEALPPR